MERVTDDYLTFFCLAKQEGINDVPEDLRPPAEGTKAELVGYPGRMDGWRESERQTQTDRHRQSDTGSYMERQIEGRLPKKKSGR